MGVIISFCLTDDGSWYDAADVSGIQPVDGVHKPWLGVLRSSTSIMMASWTFGLPYGQSLYQNETVVDPLDYRYQPDEVFLQREDGTFEPVAAAWGLDREAVSRGGIWTDIDRNGFLDFVSIAQDEEPLVHLPRAMTANGCPSRSRTWPQIRKRLVPSLRCPHQKKTQRQWVLAGGTFCIKWSHRASFWSCGCRAVDVRVIWPDGRMSELHQIATNQFVSVTRE